MRSKSSLRAFFSWIVLSLLGAWLIGFCVFVTTLPEQVEAPTEHTDAIVVLTGGQDRVTTGLTLYNQGLGDVLFISGVNYNTTIDSLINQSGIEMAKRDNIILGYVAGDTKGNAREVGHWVKQNHIHSLRLVTSTYHMKRAVFELQQVIPHVRIVINPVFSSDSQNLQTDGGWGNNMKLVTTLAYEYSKYSFVLMRHYYSSVR